jgi:hypothetical protein
VLPHPWTKIYINSRWQAILTNLKTVIGEESRLQKQEPNGLADCVGGSKGKAEGHLRSMRPKELKITKF